MGLGCGSLWPEVPNNGAENGQGNTRIKVVIPDGASAQIRDRFQDKALFSAYDPGSASPSGMTYH